MSSSRSITSVDSITSSIHDMFSNSAENAIFIPANRPIDFSLVTDGADAEQSSSVFLCSRDVRRQKRRYRRQAFLRQASDVRTASSLSSSSSTTTESGEADDDLQSLLLRQIDTSRCRSVNTQGRIVPFHPKWNPCA